MDTKRGPISSCEDFPYKGSTLVGLIARAFYTADFRYSDPTGYLISSILSLPLPKAEEGFPGASRRTTTAKRLCNTPNYTLIVL